MIISIAKKFSNNKTFDEIVSVGLEGLMEAIDKYPVARANHIGDNKGITAYIAGFVRYKILRFKAEDSLIRIPQESQRRLQIKPFSVGSSESAINHPNLAAINEILRLIATDPMEWAIIKLRRKGFTDYEVAEKLNVSVSFVNSTRKKLERRYEEMNG
jgi:DNA-directed RNA polymerase specialized sigma subunit